MGFSGMMSTEERKTKKSGWTNFATGGAAVDDVRRFEAAEKMYTEEAREGDAIGGPTGQQQPPLITYERVEALGDGRNRFTQEFRPAGSRGPVENLMDNEPFLEADPSDGDGEEGTTTKETKDGNSAADDLAALDPYYQEKTKEAQTEQLI
jgi:hypothetical protein